MTDEEKYPNKCPKCGAPYVDTSFEWSDERQLGKVYYDVFECGTNNAGKTLGLRQSDKCRIRELESELTRLRTPSASGEQLNVDQIEQNWKDVPTTGSTAGAKFSVDVLIAEVRRGRTEVTGLTAALAAERERCAKLCDEFCFNNTDRKERSCPSFEKSQ